MARALQKNLLWKCDLFTAKASRRFYTTSIFFAITYWRRYKKLRALSLIDADVGKIKCISHSRRLKMNGLHFKAEADEAMRFCIKFAMPVRRVIWLKSVSWCSLLGSVFCSTFDGALGCKTHSLTWLHLRRSETRSPNHSNSKRLFCFHRMLFILHTNV